MGYTEFYDLSNADRVLAAEYALDQSRKGNARTYVKALRAYRAAVAALAQENMINEMTRLATCTRSLSAALVSSSVETLADKES